MSRGYFSLQLLVLPLLWGCLWLTHAAEPSARSGPLSPEQAHQQFRLAPGLRIELVAAEPEIESPVAMEFDEDGKLWVVEMRDYPNGPQPGRPPEGRIRALEDLDGDGRYEHSRVFADRLLFANGLMLWKGGAVVTAAPHILYLKDCDGDGRAEQREILYEGFSTQNPQLRVSHPKLGLDNWVYVANGLRGGMVKKHGRDDARPVNISGRDFRFDLVHDRSEAISGMGQYGNSFDDWGRRFVCDNQHHLRHVVLPNRYLARNPFLAVGAVLEDVSELQPGPLGSGGVVYPISRNWTTSNLHAGHFTAACGVAIYRGDLLPVEHRGAAFTCEPTGNLVHEEILRPHGATFRSRPARDKAEFLASTDDWFRPVSLAHGPDGALYVVDMYRAVIEHPEWMPPELKQRPDLNLGKDRGRIWRIVPEGHKTTAMRPNLGQTATVDLVPLLGDANAWRRSTAQRLLLERQDHAAVESLRKLCLNSDRPLARVQAAWILEGMNALDVDLVARLLRDDHPRVREQALVLCERWLPKSAAIQKEALALAADADAQVRFQAALSLGEWDDDRIVPALVKIATTDADDRWTRAAVASAVPKRAGALLAILLKTDTELTAKATQERLALVQELATIVGSRLEASEVTAALSALKTLSGKDGMRWQVAGLNGLANGMGRRGRQLSEFLRELPAEHRQAADAAEDLLAQAGRVCTDSKRELGERLDAVRLLAHARPEAALPILSRLLGDDPVPEIRLAAVRALASQPSADVPSLLMKSWTTYTPALRREVVESMLRLPDRARFLLDELEAKHVAPGDLDLASQNRLLKHAQVDIRRRAGKLLQAGIAEERKQVLERYRKALTKKGDPGRGREVFRQNCATCHQVAAVGTTVGPDISDTRTKTPEMLLQDILSPNAAIDANYVNYIVTTKSGKEMTGIIAAETASSVTLRRAENQTDSVLRQDIEEVRSTGVSLMPEGLEKTITIEQMADLISFLKNWRYLDGNTPGVDVGR
ncbi:MAG TPA: PVC-type heme-binding CxxCH protein [Gemmataceae bacterium]|jgi:putative membrane-bound dehydrogenase-like protein